MSALHVSDWVIYFEFDVTIRKILNLTFLTVLIIGAILSGCAPTAPTSLPRPSVLGPVVMGAPTPSALSASQVSGTIIHEVGPMETLWRIAKEYDVDIQRIMQANGISNQNQIKIGQKLKIPDTLGLRPVIPLYKTRPWSFIIIHHTATDIGNASFIHKAHHQRGFWDGLGYHFLIDNGTLGKLDGQIEISPRWIKQMDGAHCNASGMNQNGIGVSLVGNFSEKGRVSPKQLESLVFITSTLMKHYRIPIDHVMKHGAVPGKQTECPGKHFSWSEFIARLKQATS